MATDLSAKKNSYVSRLCQRTVSLIDAFDELDSLRLEWDEARYAFGAADAITDEDLGSFPHLTAGDLTMMMSTVDAFAQLRSQGHGTTMQKLRS